MRTLVTFGLGALAMYLFDPQQGRGRRASIRDRLGRAGRVVRGRAGRTAAPDLSFRDYATATQVPGAEPGKPSQAPQGAQHLGR